MSDDRPLGPQARDLLEAFKAEETPLAERRDEVWASVSRPRARPRLRTTNSVDNDEEAERSGAGSPQTGWVIAMLAAAAVAAVAIGFVRDRAESASRHDDPMHHAAPYASEPSPAQGQAGIRTPAPQPRVRAVPSPVPPAVSAPEASPASAPNAGLAPAPLQRPTPEPDARAEIAEIKRAKDAMAAGDASAAVEILERSARLFARGQLQHERDAIYVEALCAAGRRAEARTTADRILARTSTHAYADRLRAACR